MEHRMVERRIRSGDRVRHTVRPEWGVGVVINSEPVSVDGALRQRLSIRFPNEGLKTLVTSAAELELITESSNGLPHAAEHPLASFGALAEGDWLAPHAKKKIEEAMISLPMDARDPFNGLKRRLDFTLGLYRFDRTDRKLQEWAVAQSGLQDPLTRFTRHELEQLFDRWAFERDNHLGRLLQEARNEPAVMRDALAKAPPAARHVVRRFTSSR
jgi:hypothetical protein